MDRLYRWYSRRLRRYLYYSIVDGMRIDLHPAYALCLTCRARTEVVHVETPLR